MIISNQASFAEPFFVIRNFKKYTLTLSHYCKYEILLMLRIFKSFLVHFDFLKNSEFGLN